MTKKSMVKLVTLLLAFVLIVSSTTGCSNASEEQVSEGNKQPSSTAAVDSPSEQNESPITFSILIGDSAFTHKWGEDPVSRYVTEKTGVSLDIQIPNGDVRELLSTMIAARDLPDLLNCSGHAEQQWMDLIDGDLVYALTDLADQYDPSFYEAASPQILLWHARPDGKTYWYPSYAWDMEHINKYSDRFEGYYTYFVRKDVYEGIGSPDMRTQEGWLNALREVKEKYPEINGQPIQMLGVYEFGESGSWTFDELLQNCLNIPYEVDNEWIDRRTDPDYREWFKTFRKAYEEGLITKTMIVENWDQTKERMARGEFFSMLGQHNDFQQTFTDLAIQDPNSTYIPVDPPANSKLDQPLFTAGNVNGWVRLGVTKKCIDPERAIKFITYLISEEGRHDMYLGIEGETWEVRDGKHKLKPEVEAANKAGWNDVRKYGAGQTWHVFSQPIVDNQWIYPEDDTETSIMTPFKDYFKKVGVVAQPYTSGILLDPNSEEVIIENKMNLKFGEILPKMIMADSDGDVDALWAEYDAYAQEIGYQKVLDAKTNMLLENKRKLGLLD